MTYAPRYDQKDKLPRQTQVCESCNEEKDLSHFYAHVRPNDCMECIQRDEEQHDDRLWRLNRPEVRRY